MCIPSSTNPTTTYDPPHSALRHLLQYVTCRALVRRWGANGSGKSVDKSVDWSVDWTCDHVLSILKTNPRATLDQVANVVGFSVRGVEQAIKRLKKAKRIRKVGGKRFGHWEVIR
jgi:ATP-dependent DNA helicase RecG